MSPGPVCDGSRLIQGCSRLPTDRSVIDDTNISRARHTCEIRCTAPVRFRTGFSGTDALSRLHGP